MSPKKRLATALMILVLGSFLFPQSLAEIAQKERERRAALKGKKAAVVTNATLAKLKKKPALETPPAPPAPSVEETAPPAEAAPTPPANLQEQPPAALPPAAQPVPPDIKTLQERWEKAKEYVELLTLKMGALWQQFYGLEDMTAKNALQQAIAETFAKLQTAQEEETQARQALEKALGQQKKEPAPLIWVR
jgi:hypothetical protein